MDRCTLLNILFTSVWILYNQFLFRQLSSHHIDRNRVLLINNNMAAFCRGRHRWKRTSCFHVLTRKLTGNNVFMLSVDTQSRTWTD